MRHGWRHAWAEDVITGVVLALLALASLSWWAAKKLGRWL